MRRWSCPSRGTNENVRRASPGGGKNKVMDLKKIFRSIACTSLVGLGAGCTSPPPLDDAQLGEITLATIEDRARLREAEEHHARETFGSVTFSRGPNQAPITFGPDDYDAYLAYLENHPEEGLTPTSLIVGILPKSERWPLLRLTFRSNRPLFDESDLLPSVDFYLCDKNTQGWELYGFGTPRLVWQNKIVYPPVSKEIDNSLKKSASPQEYEVFFSYIYWGHTDKNDETRHPILMPLPGDLCISMFSGGFFSGPRVGRPLRIDKDLVNAAVGDLPRAAPHL